MKEGRIFGQLGKIFEPKRTEAQALLTTLGESVFSGMDSKRLSLVQYALEIHSAPQSIEGILVKRSLEKLGIFPPPQPEKPAEQLYILNYITTAAETGNIRNRLTNSALARREKTILQKQLNNNTKALLALEEELQGEPRGRSVLPQNLKELRLSRAEIEDAKKYAESMYKEKKSSPEQADPYKLDDEHTAIPILPIDQVDRLFEATSDLHEAIANKFIAWKQYAELYTTPVNIPEDEVGKEKQRLIERGSLGNVKDILSRLGLNFNKINTVSYALSYICSMAYIQLNKSLLEKLPEQVMHQIIEVDREMFAEFEEQFQTEAVGEFGMSRQEMTETRQKVEKAFLAHPNAFAMEDSVG